MSLLIWRIICIVSAVLFAATVVTLFVTRLLKNKYYHNCVKDELLKTEKKTNSVNSIYLTSGETKKFIKKYVVCKTAYDRYLVCNFTKSFTQIRFFVIQYTGGKRVVSVLKISDGNTGTASKVIALSRRCEYVNLVVARADGAVINTEVIRPIALPKLRLYAFLKSAAIFFGLFVLRHVIVEIFGGAIVIQYLNHYLDFAVIGGSFLLAVLSYFVTIACFRRKNVKEANGGVLEYEFV